MAKTRQRGLAPVLKFIVLTSDHMIQFHDASSKFRITFAGAVAQDSHSGRGKGAGSGGANCVFADGSPRYYNYGAAFDPLNLWAVTDADRTANMINFH